MNTDLLIKRALEEDIREGDITTNAIVSQLQKAIAHLIMKQDAILCGMDVVKKVFLSFDNTIEFKKVKEDGQAVKKGEIIAEISGKARSLLSCERTALNFLQRLSGIATTANHYVQKLQRIKQGTVQLLDTRKTIPGYRELEKYAVKTGGAINHRHGLYDMVLIKDNHIIAAGSLRKAIENVQQNQQYQQLKKAKQMKIEVEIETLEQLEQLFGQKLDRKIDMVMLDNFFVGETKKAVSLIRENNKSIKIEFSGGITLNNIADYAKTGVDCISVGAALTLSAKSVDIGFEIKQDSW